MSIQEKTAGGLFVAPVVSFHWGHSANPNKVFNPPMEISFTFFDKNGVVRDHTGQARYLSRDPNTLFNSVTNNVGTSHVMLGTTPTGGSWLSTPERVHSISDDNLGKLYTVLARKAGENITNGTTNITDITKIIDRDNGVYEGDEITNFKPFANGPKDEALYTKKKSKGMLTSIFDHLTSMKDDPTKSLVELSNKMIRAKTSSREMQITGRTIMSAIVNGIGARNFMPALLDAMDETEPGLADHYITVNQKAPKLLKLIMRSLKVGTPHHERVVRLQYKNMCD